METTGTCAKCKIAYSADKSDCFYKHKPGEKDDEKSEGYYYVKCSNCHGEINMGSGK